MLREKAYKIDGRGMQAWREEGDFRKTIENHEEVRRFLTSEQIAKVFSVERQLRSVDAIFARVFNQ